MMLRAAPPDRRAWRLNRLWAEATAADRLARETGRVHPRWGDGSLMAAALRRDLAREPDLADRDYCHCLAAVYERLALSPRRSRHSA